LTVDEIIKKHVKKQKIPGISIGLIDENGTQFFNYGEIKKESGIEPTSDTLYEIGSMTKTFTAILAVQLQNEGLLSLDDPITKFLPEFVGTDFDKNKITLYHLITHTSGLVEVPLREIIKFMIKFIFRTTNGKFFPPRYSLDTSNFLQEISRLKLKDNPGTKFRYSNSGVGLVGKILERVTNSTYEELIKSRIWNELNMHDTTITISEKHKEKLATGYLHTGKQADPISTRAIESAGSIRSTVSDMLKFLKVNLDLEQSSLSPAMEYCKSTRSDPSLSLLDKYTAKLFLSIESTEIGLGWIAANVKNTSILQHAGGTEGFSTIMIINPNNKTGVVVLSNVAIKNNTKLSLELLKKLNDKENEN
jgi:CubicO group peptidase (beta-lactamase class C family)